MARPSSSQPTPVQSHPPPPSSSISEEATSKTEDLDVPLDVGILREIAKRQLIHVLNSVR